MRLEPDRIQVACSNHLFVGHGNCSLIRLKSQGPVLVPVAAFDFIFIFKINNLR